MPLLKRTPKKSLITARPECCFWTTNGMIMKDLKELENALKEMAESVFLYHVSKARNDFSKWVQEVMEDPELAKKLEKAKTKKTALKEVQKHLKARYQ